VAMSVEQMRHAIGMVYNGQKWKAKVLSMSEKQVMAVYRYFLDAKKLK
jgi:hypothetical protein